MSRLYLVDSYNVILQDKALNEILDYEGLTEARRAMKEVATDFARRTGCRVRLVFDGNQDPFSHIETSEDQWVEVSFTSRGEKADERLVAIALECRRRGVRPIVVSDDVAGIREPLAEAGFPLLSTVKFAQMMRSDHTQRIERRGEALSEESRRDLETEFLARDAEARRRSEIDRLTREARRDALTRSGPKPAPPADPPSPGAPSGAAPSATPNRASSRSRSGIRSAPPAESSDGNRPGVVPRPADPADAARKERGRRKQERRLALLQSRRTKKR